MLSEIYTVLNPDPKILDEFVKSEKDVPIEIRIVSGDNVNIEKINGKGYRAENPVTRHSLPIAFGTQLKRMIPRRR